MAVRVRQLAGGAAGPALIPQPCPLLSIPSQSLLTPGVRVGPIAFSKSKAWSLILG